MNEKGMVWAKVRGGVGGGEEKRGEGGPRREVRRKRGWAGSCERGGIDREGGLGNGD